MGHLDGGAQIAQTLCFVLSRFGHPLRDTIHLLLEGERRCYSWNLHHCCPGSNLRTPHHGRARRIVRPSRGLTQLQKIAASKDETLAISRHELMIVGCCVLESKATHDNKPTINFGPSTSADHVSWMVYSLRAVFSLE